MGRVVLVTGLARDLGSQFARRIAADAIVDKVVGVDLRPPPGNLLGVSYVRADICTPVIGKVLAVEDVDTVVHLAVPPAGARHRPSRSAGVQRHRQHAAAG